MGVGNEIQDYLQICQGVFEQLDGFCKRLEENIDKKQQELKARKKNTELEHKIAQEMKLHQELTEHLSKLANRTDELDRVCASFETHLTIADSDQNRLDIARETYQIEKEMTGIRFDFSSTPNIAKGYIKSESRRLLQPFEVSSTDSGALWALVAATAAPGWPGMDKENTPCN